MTRDQLLDLIKHGREIEFKYNNKMYSITYGRINGEYVISFCEFYKESTVVTNPEAVCDIDRDGTTVIQMLESIGEEDIWIY